MKLQTEFLFWVVLYQLYAMTKVFGVKLISVRMRGDEIVVRLDRRLRDRLAGMPDVPELVNSHRKVLLYDMLGNFW